MVWLVALMMLLSFSLPEDVPVLLPEVFVEVAVEEGVDDGVGQAAQVQDRVDHNLLARDVGQHQ